MPTKRSYAKKSKRRKNYARRTGPSLRANRWNRQKRVGQNLTRDLRYFKAVRTIVTNTNGNFRAIYSPPNIIECNDWLNWAKIWEEFKILSVSVKFFPASVGSEALQEANTGTQSYPGNVATFKRGNVVTWVDQGELDAPGAFGDIIIKPSAKLINPRRAHKRWINRPMGNPNWGQLDPDGAISLPDEWNDSRIQIFGENFTPIQAAGNQSYYYVMITYKVLFRGRQMFADDTTSVPVQPL